MILCVLFPISPQELMAIIQDALSGQTDLFRNMWPYFSGPSWSLCPTWPGTDLCQSDLAISPTFNINSHMNLCQQALHSWVSVCVCLVSPVGFIQNLISFICCVGIWWCYVACFSYFVAGGRGGSKSKVIESYIWINKYLTACELAHPWVFWCP